MTPRRLHPAALGGLMIAAVLCVPAVAAACPVCFSAQNEENRAAFVLMTVFLTLLPLGMLGLGLGWAWRRLRAQDAGRGELTSLNHTPPRPDSPAT